MARGRNPPRVRGSRRKHPEYAEEADPVAEIFAKTNEQL